MTITLNHTIVPALDNRAAARFFASITGLTESPPAGRHGHFIPVRGNETLPLDFMTVPDAEGHHLAFDLDPAACACDVDPTACACDEIPARRRGLGVPYGSGPAHPGGRTDHPLCPRGLFLRDATGDLYEVTSPA